ncbi:MAG: F0F1 ATP synthase subunit A [Rickettsiales bacterium]
MAGEGHSPLEQFRIAPIVPLRLHEALDISLTNSGLAMLAAAFAAIAFFSFAVRRRELVPGRLQSVAELAYQFISDMVRNSVGDGGRRFFPMIFSVFIFVLFCNLLGLIPGAFTATSHISMTFALAVAMFVVLNVYGVARHGMKFFTLFLPHGTPIVFAPLIVVIELFSYLVRPVSLSIRLAANMIAGHTMLKVVAGFVPKLGLFGFVPIGFLVALTGFELFVAVLQAYIFSLLLCVYLNDAVNLH